MILCHGQLVGAPPTPLAVASTPTTTRASDLPPGVIAFSHNPIVSHLPHLPAIFGIFTTVEGVESVIVLHSDYEWRLATITGTAHQRPLSSIGQLQL
jgi:hypothetical protein